MFYKCQKMTQPKDVINVRAQTVMPRGITLHIFYLNPDITSQVIGRV